MTLQLGGPIPCWHVSPSLLLLFVLILIKGGIKAGLTLSGFLWASIWAWGWTCWRQLSMSKVWYSLRGADNFWFAMGLEGVLGMGLLASCE